MQEVLKTLTTSLARGWNTWNTNSVMSFVKLPDAFCFTLNFKEYGNSHTIRDAFLGPIGTEGHISAGKHTVNGSYISLTFSWLGMECKIEGAHIRNDMVVLVRPLKNHPYPATLIIESGYLWNKSGSLSAAENSLKGISDNETQVVFVEGTQRTERNVPCHSPFLTFSTESIIGISTGIPRTRQEIESIIDAAGKNATKSVSGWGKEAELVEAIESVISWNTIYEPEKERVISPVSRRWSAEDHGGYMLFTWDTFFASVLSCMVSKDLSYSNAISMTAERLPEGYLPAMACNLFNRGKDRSQPPVGSLCVSLIAEHASENTLIEALFPDLYGWNTWYWDNRHLGEGVFAWGYSHKYCTSTNVNYESGLDNSPMYDNIPVKSDSLKVQMELADVGFISLMAMDSRILSKFARNLGKEEDAHILEQRAVLCENALKTLWCEEKGIFLNKRTDTGAWDFNLSPTLFYPLLTNAVSPYQAQRMMDEHFYNPQEFWGEWILPSISRDNPAYKEQHYWRGPIWAPMNFLVYIGLSRAGLEKPQADLAEKSKNLLLKEYREKHHIHENWNANTGDGCPDPSSRNKSDPFYHWGALMALIALMQKGSFKLSKEFLLP